MNNANGEALLLRVRDGSLVTVRGPDGSQVTGRARDTGFGFWHILNAAGRSIAPVNAVTIIKVAP